SSRASHLICLDPYVHRRTLPSFPTRRSSDLRIFRNLSRRDSSLSFGAIVTGGSCLLPAISHHLLEHAHLWIRIRQEASVVSDRGDRKSTRLNSSHVSISYAVFCLKKRKIIRV